MVLMFIFSACVNRRIASVERWHQKYNLKIAVDLPMGSWAFILVGFEDPNRMSAQFCKYNF